ncbi:TraB/GumN family protein [Candidatus Woesearchaeota archaeon]|nr:TraB/GumN family protein [Candidatus Woesearchaeota archaeon]
MHIDNLTLLGTSHIAAQSVQQVKKAIEEDKPDIVALELDKRRFAALLSGSKGKYTWKDMKRIGFKGFLFAMLGEWAERKLGEQVGVKPGSEMVAAATLAKQKNIEIALIDQDIEITLRRFSAAITWKEKLRFVWDLLTSFFRRKVPFDLKKVPNEKIIQELTGKVKQDYPNVYRVLVDERNAYMAEQLSTLLSRNPEKKILAIIGAGHEKEIVDLIQIRKTPLFSYTFEYDEE